MKGQGIAEILDDSSSNRWLIDKGDDELLAELIKKSIINPIEMPKLNIYYDIDNLIGAFLKENRLKH